MKVLSQKETLERVRLDKKDLRVLAVLVNNSRTPLSQIANKVRLSRASVEYRIKKMRENELIVGSRTVINLPKLGYNSYHIFVESLKVEDEKTLVERAVKNPSVNAIISYSGRFGMEISIIARNPAEFMAHCENLFQGLSINYSTPLILLNTIHSIVLPKKFFKGIEVSEISEVHTPVVSPKYNIDSTDIEILKKVSNNADLSVMELSKELGITKDIAQYRLKKMVENKIILQFRPAINYSVLGLAIHSLLIKTDGGRSEELENFLKNSESVLWAVRAFGDWQYLVYIIADDNFQLHTFIQEIKSKFENVVKNYELLFAYKEYKYSFFSDSIKIG